MNAPHLPTSSIGVENLITLGSRLFGDGNHVFAAAIFENARMMISEQYSAALSTLNLGHGNFYQPEELSVFCIGSGSQKQCCHSYFPFLFGFSSGTGGHNDAGQHHASSAAFVPAQLMHHSAVCLFNLALCLQEVGSERSLEAARNTYHSVWRCLKLCPLDENTMLLSMALALNLTFVSQSLGQVEDARQWYRFLAIMLASPKSALVADEFRVLFSVAWDLGKPGSSAAAA